MIGLQALNEKKNHETPGGLPVIFLKICSGILACLLINLFHQSLKSGIFPEQLKLNSVITVFKSVCKNRLKNYRSICESTFIAKLFDSSVATNSSPLFGNIFIEEKHGFIQKRSISTNLLVYSDYILESIKEANPVNSIYTDFMKAFDSVA